MQHTVILVCLYSTYRRGNDDETPELRGTDDDGERAQSGPEGGCGLALARNFLNPAQLILISAPDRLIVQAAQPADQIAAQLGVFDQDLEN